MPLWHRRIPGRRETIKGFAVPRLPTLGDTKSPVSSKTLWINGLSFAAIILAAVIGSEQIKEYPQWAAAGAAALAAVNFALRFLTSEPII